MDSTMSLRELARCCVLSLFGAAAAAQCTNTFTNAGSLAGTDAEVRALAVWDRDGAGPLPPSIVVAGAFTASGSVLGRGIACFDPATATWTDIGGGMSGVFLGAVAVHAIAVLPGGDLVAAGQFQRAGGVVATSIARWNGTSWTPFADGIGGYVYALATLPNGDLVAAGDFFLADGVYVDNIARWNGVTWQPLGAGLEGTVNALAVLGNGDLIAGGAITASGTTPIGRLARWDGAAWSVFGGGFTGEVHALAVHPSGDLYVGGAISNPAVAGANGIVRRSGNSWFALGTGINDVVRGIAFDGSGQVVVCGSFQFAGGQSASRVARWNGSVWSPLGSGLSNSSGFARAVVVAPNGQVYVGGSFRDIYAVGSDHVRRFDGSTWSGLGVGTNGVVQCMLRKADGTVFLGGTITQADDVPVNGVALWNGTQWSAMGSGVVNGDVRCCAELPNGDLVVGGQFSTIGGVVAANVARWNGSSWQPMGAGLPDTVWSLAVRPGGQLVAGGAFFERVATWDGTTWNGTGVGSSFASFSPVRAMVVRADGDLFASSASLVGSAAYARWDGSVWTSLGTPVGMATAMLALRNGDVLATAGNQVMRWSAGTWSQVGGVFNGSSGGSLSMIRTLFELPNGDVLAGGTFASVITNGILQPRARLARFDGVAWQAVGAGANGSVLSIVGGGPAEVLLGGEFSVVADALAPRFVRMGTSCAPIAVVAGSPCSGSGGINALAANTLPWLGATFRSTATGMPSLGLVVRVVGFAPTALPLNAVFAEGVAGCALSVTPDLLDAALPTAGAVVWSLPLPRDQALVGLVLRQQVVPFEFDASGALLAVTASNALVLTLGWF